MGTLCNANRTSGEKSHNSCFQLNYNVDVTFKCLDMCNVLFSTDHHIKHLPTAELTPLPHLFQTIQLQQLQDRIALACGQRSEP